MPSSNQTAWSFVPTTYFAEGLPYIIINVLSAAVYTSLNIPNDVFIFWTSWLYLPWVIKMFWSPFVDSYSTKRKWLLASQVLLAAVFLLVALSFNLNSFFTASLCGFLAGAIISATQDIATDGFYMLALDQKQQAFFVGIRTLFYRLAMIAGGGALPILAGYLQKQTGNMKFAWSVTLGAAGILFFLFYAWHLFILPKPAEDKPVKTETERPLKNFKASFKSYFTQPHIWTVLAFILLYRVGEALLEKITTPFLLRPVSEGAMGLTLHTFGLIKGTYGMIAIIAGNILGGFLLSRFGFRKCIWPFALALTVPNLVYLYMAYAHPAPSVIGLLLVAEQFGYGLGFMAFTVFVMNICEGNFKTSHYAISTGIMALGMMIPGMLSGFLQMHFGYKMFYWIVAVCSVPGLLTVPFILKIPATEK